MVPFRRNGGLKNLHAVVRRHPGDAGDINAFVTRRNGVSFRCTGVLGDISAVVSQINVVATRRNGDAGNINAFVTRRSSELSEINAFVSRNPCAPKKTTSLSVASPVKRVAAPVKRVFPHDQRETSMPLSPATHERRKKQHRCRLHHL